MKIRYVLLNAYATGGTVRTVGNQINSMVAAGHDVELVSVTRHKEELPFPLDSRVSVTALVDGYEPTPEAEADAEDERHEQEARLVPAGEFAARRFSRYVEDTVADYFSGLDDGILVTTRPALNILAAHYAPTQVIRVAQEHMNLGTHREDVQKAIARDYPSMDAVAVLTQRDREEYAELLPGTQVIRIPNAVHSMDQEPSTYTNKVALAAGRFATQKGFDMLIPAFKKVAERHPDWQLRIYGGGEKKKQLRNLIEEHHLYNHVFLMGTTSELDAELAKASFYVLSSRFEGLPMVMIEAMTHALPVVSFDCPTGPAEVITDGEDGLLVPPNDTDGLAEAMSRLMADQDLRAEMGAAALKTANEFSPDALHPQWESLFTELWQARGWQE